MSEVQDGVERYFLRYRALPHQQAFHESKARHRLLGGAAGPGKTLALIMDHMMHCNRFSPDIAPQVHTVIFRRTYPKLASTVITRFREKVPRELYQDYNEQHHIVTWRNGATTQFGSMQHEHDVWGWQGQWYKIGYDELTEFTFQQWQNISAWNRCPVAKNSTKDGATNPIGIGAAWVESVFVKHQPCVEMEANQKALYKVSDYDYFPATYLANPIYANDANYIKNLDSYQSAIGRALKEGIWGVAGGYFEGAWDEAVNVYAAGSFEMKPWYRKWLGGDWGFDHNSVIHWFCMDDLGVIRIYRELVRNRHTPEELAEAIAKNSTDENGNIEKYEMFSLSHDAFAKKQDINTVGSRIGDALAKYGICAPICSTKDKLGREQILYDKLKGRIRNGRIFNDAENREEYTYEPELQIADCCPNLIATIPKSPRDEDNTETIAEFLGDDALQSSGYGLYAMFGKPRQKPFELRVIEKLEQRIGMPLAQVNPDQYTNVMIQRAVVVESEKRSEKPMRLIHGRRRR